MSVYIIAQENSFRYNKLNYYKYNNNCERKKYTGLSRERAVRSYRVCSVKIGCGTVLFRKFGLEESLAAIRSIGFEYFETQAVGPWCPHVNVEKDDPEGLVRLKERYGFKGITGLWSLNGNIIPNPDAVRSGILSIEWAAAAGIPVLHTGDGNKPAGMSDEEAFDVLEEKLGRILEAAKKNGVTVAIEPHGTFSLTKTGLARILSLGSPEVLGINYDGCNIFRSSYVESGNGVSGWKSADGNEDELDVLKAVADRVVHCHIKDINKEKKCVAAGDGLVNVGGIIRYLGSKGYSGAVSLETEGGNDFSSIVELAKKSFDYLKATVSKAESDCRSNETL